MRFSLIIATKGRTAELAQFLDALHVQGTQDMEVIIVDQNIDDRLGSIISAHKKYFQITHLRSPVANSSHARNLGINIANGEIIAFPDDDCEYPEGLLRRVDEYFAHHSEIGILTGPSRGYDGALGSGRWNPRSGEIDYNTIWTSLIEFSMFFSRASLPIALQFDEELGVGAKYGSGEGADLVLTLMQAGVRVYYDFHLFVTHPNKALTKIAVDRAFAYGTGFGRVLRKHAEVIPWRTIIRFFIRPIGGILLSAVRGHLLQMRYYMKTLGGRIVGFSSKTDKSVNRNSDQHPARITHAA